MINVGGYKVNPFEIEECLMDLEEVKEAIVFGKPNSVLETFYVLILLLKMILKHLKLKTSIKNFKILKFQELLIMFLKLKKQEQVKKK